MSDHYDTAESNDDPDWAAYLRADAGPGQVWTMPESMTITRAPAVAAEHWQRLIALANEVLADAAVQTCLTAIGSLLGVDRWPVDSPIRLAAILAHMVHPYTIAADTGHPTEADYYRQDCP